MIKIKIKTYQKENRPIIVKQYEKLPNFFSQRAIKRIKKDLEEIEQKGQKDQCLVAYLDHEIVGNLIWVKEESADQVYEFKWLATDCSMRYKPYVFQALIQKGEDLLKEKARLYVVYTSNRPNEKNTQLMFLRLGYVKQAVLPDYWDEGDDRVIFLKRNPYYKREKEVNMQEFRKVLAKEDQREIRTFLMNEYTKFQNEQAKERKIPLDSELIGYATLMKVLEIEENEDPVQTVAKGTSPIVFINYYKSQIPNLYLVRKEKFDELDQDSMTCELVFTKQLEADE